MEDGKETINVSGGRDSTMARPRLRPLPETWSKRCFPNLWKYTRALVTEDEAHARLMRRNRDARVDRNDASDMLFVAARTMSNGMTLNSKTAFAAYEAALRLRRGLVVDDIVTHALWFAFAPFCIRSSIRREWAFVAAVCAAAD